jgi:hypothetical protein
MRWLLAAVMLVAACSTTPLGSSPDSVSEVPSTVSGPTTAAGTPSTTTPAGSSTAPSGRETAPDFTLALHGGGSYTLSEENRPVYLLFWAEW